MVYNILYLKNALVVANKIKLLKNHFFCNKLYFL